MNHSNSYQVISLSLSAEIRGRVTDCFQLMNRYGWRDNYITLFEKKTTFFFLK